MESNRPADPVDLVLDKTLLVKVIIDRLGMTCLWNNRQDYFSGSFLSHQHPCTIRGKQFPLLCLNPICLVRYTVEENLIDIVRCET